tara:strand:- start:209 stop:1531 length:1323 start_codon:yes stop_codon:yes gene_type:complete
MTKTKKYLLKANKLIPGVSQLLGKRPEMYLKDGNWPTFYKRAKGINIWDLDNKKYYDFSLVSAGTCVLGYSDKDVNKASIKAIKSGSISTLNPPEDVELADMLLKDHKWAGGVRYVRGGGESMRIAVRLARAYTKREKILFCGYHGWHDWYLSANHKSKKNLDFQLLPGLKPLGVPKGLSGTVLPFRYNNDSDYRNIIKRNIKKAAAIVIEPCREGFPNKRYLSKLKSLAKKNNTVLIFDEITSGWRLNSGGSHMVVNVTPDIVIYGKTIANGIPMGAIIGRKKIMDYALKTFVSSVFWTEKVGPASALAFIKKYKKLKLGKKLIETGKQIKRIWLEAAKRNNLDIEISGIDPLASFKILCPNWPEVLTYFIQEMLKYKILCTNQCYANYKHDKQSLKIYKDACFKVFNKISISLKSGDIKNKLNGPVKQMGFNRLTEPK